MPVEITPKAICVVDGEIGPRILLTTDKDHCFAIVMTENMVDLIASEIIAYRKAKHEKSGSPICAPA